MVTYPGSGCAGEVRRVNVETLSPVEHEAPSGPQWTFFGASSLPTDPVARQHERRGRRWLVVSFLFCPCHVPILLVAVGAAFGGTALGALIAGHALWVGIVLTSMYAVLLWRGFRQIRRAKRLERGGGTLRCAPEGCFVVAPHGVHPPTS